MLHSRRDVGLPGLPLKLQSLPFLYREFLEKINRGMPPL